MLYLSGMNGARRGLTIEPPRRRRFCPSQRRSRCSARRSPFGLPNRGCVSRSDAECTAPPGHPPPRWRGRLRSAAPLPPRISRACASACVRGCGCAGQDDIKERMAQLRHVLDEREHYLLSKALAPSPPFPPPFGALSFPPLSAHPTPLPATPFPASVNTRSALWPALHPGVGCDAGEGGGERQGGCD